MPDIYGFTLRVHPGANDDVEELIKATGSLRNELLDLDVASVDPVDDPRRRRMPRVWQPSQAGFWCSSAASPA
jgi:hypothetical protein